MNGSSNYTKLDNIERCYQDVHLQNNLEAGLDLDLGPGGPGDCGAKGGYRGAGPRVNIGDIDEMVSTEE